jgi:hypothetical protein
MIKNPRMTGEFQIIHSCQVWDWKVIFIDLWELWFLEIGQGIKNFKWANYLVSEHLPLNVLDNSPVSFFIIISFHFIYAYWFHIMIHISGAESDDPIRVYVLEWSSLSSYPSITF